MDSKEDIYELFFGICEVNVGSQKGVTQLKSYRIELENAILELIVDVVNQYLKHLFLPFPTLGLKFENESINDNGVKFLIYNSIRENIISKVESYFPKDFNDNTNYRVALIDWVEIPYTGELTLGYKKVIYVKDNSKVLMPINVIELNTIDIKDYLDRTIRPQTLDYIENLEWYKDSVSKMTSIPNTDEHKLIKSARTIYKSEKKKNKDYTYREALVQANENEGYLFGLEIEVEKIKHRRKEKLQYLVSKKFTDALIEKCEMRDKTDFDITLDNKRTKRNRRKGG